MIKHNFFNKEWTDKWQNYFSQKDDLKDKIIKLEDNNFYDVNNAFGKLDKTLQICDFLRKLSISQDQDTEKIIITTFVSCAEAVYRINKPSEQVNENLVKGFFKPIKLNIDDKIGVCSIKELPNKKINAIEVLYLIRNDYIHNGNFTGGFFQSDDSENRRSYCNFYLSEKNKTKLISATSTCCLTYDEFKKIFLEAFIKNIEKYCNKINGVS